ncbi:hypothetical protein AVEN_65780-1 [Araneus ventricosus]|uniref:DNA helicase Pif1-like 2B domain-containing protein n=1 Tax=Araneus ventricosus TaxID=182803 RepID=A0A4Y2M9Y0_ARAVE|nr:hypothetical protein AVEN_65780-1 [Araneus ventricosus]
MPGNEVISESMDNIVSNDPQDQLAYTEEFLNSLTPTGMPPHKLRLKPGAIIMLLRNLAPSKGLCNGTRLIILAAWRELGDSPRDSKWLAGAWWRALASGLEKREKRGEEDLPDERVPVDKKEKVMRNEKEGGSKALKLNTCPCNNRTLGLAFYELDSMLLR